MMNELFYNIANGMMIDFSANQSTLHYFIMMHFYVHWFWQLVIVSYVTKDFFMLLSFSYG